MTELAAFVYPWDVAADGPETVAAQLADLGVSRIDIATAYHSAETIRPRRLDGVHVRVEPNVAHLPLDVSRFGELAPRQGTLAREQADLYPRLAKTAGEAGMSLSGWTIALHQSALATAFPKHSLENCFGDPSTHALCPANPAVADYAVELCSAVARTGFFDELMLESLSYGLVGHGHPHELWAVRLDTATRYLLSLCFCGSCLMRGQSAGIDGDALRRWTRQRLNRLWNSPLSAVRAADNGEEMSALLAENADLAAWSRMRRDVVTELTRRATDAAAEAGARLVMGSAVWARPAPLNWMEGIDFGSMASVCDGVALMAYHEATAAVARDIDFATTMMPAEKIQLLQTIWPSQHAGVDTLLEKLRLARAAGVKRFGLYNFGMASAPLLEWLRAAAAAINE